MFEAYKVGVILSVTNKISSVLSAVASDFAKTDRSAKSLVRTIGSLKAAQLGLAGVLTGGGGFMGLKLIAGAVKPANEYVAQLNRMNIAGMKQAEIAQSIADAWKNTSTVMTTTATQNLGTILDLRNVLGSNKGMGEIEALLPVVSKIQAVMSASSNMNLASHADDIAFGMAKALDIIGAVRDPDEMQKQAAMMAKAIEFSQGRVSPQMFQSAFNYARQAKFDLSDDFKYEILPSLMLEYANKGGGGGSRGVGPMMAAFYRLTNQGYINAKAMPELVKLGLASPGDALKTTTTGTTLGHGMTGAALAAQDPYQWVNNILVPAIRKAYPNANDSFIRQEINALMRGNQLAASLAVEFYTKQSNFQRDQDLIRGAMPYDQAYISALANNPKTALAALGAQWENLKTSIGITVVPIILPALHGLADAFNSLGKFLKDHQTITAALTWTFTSLSGLALIGGSLMIAGAALKMMAPAFTLLRLPLIAMAGIPLAGIASGLGLLTAALAALAPIVYHKEIAGWIDKHAPGVGDFLYKVFDPAAVAGPMGSSRGAKGGYAPPPSNAGTYNNPTVLMVDGRVLGQISNNYSSLAAGTAAANSYSGVDYHLIPVQAGGF